MDNNEIVPVLGIPRRNTWLDERPTPKLIETFVNETYVLDHYERLAKRAGKLISDKIDLENKKLAGEGIQAFVRYRAKTKKSLREKLLLSNEEAPYKDSEQIRKVAVDLAGVRIILYTPSKSQYQMARKIIHEIFGKDVEEKLHGSKERDPKPPLVKSQNRTKNYQPIHLGYQAVHYLPFMKKEHSLDGVYNWIDHDRVEIQVTSALGHAWAEAGHDVLYKSYAYGPSTVQEQRIFDAINGLVQSGDLLLEQFHELLTQRTTAKITNIYEFGYFLKTLDVLQDPKVTNSITKDGMEVLLNFLIKTGNNYPLAIRQAIKQIGFPDQLHLNDIISMFDPTFEPAEDMKTVICLIHHLIPEYSSVVQISLPVRQTEDFESYQPGDKCCIMMSALGLLKVFLSRQDHAGKFLRNKLYMTNEERVSLDWILTSSRRQVTLDKSDKHYMVNQQKIADSVSEGWNWFEKQAKEKGSICGLVFKLALMDATKPFQLESSLLELESFGSLTRHSTDDSDDD
ncbi:hypothetical protein BP6252_03446 [Coleophoma cylindrospora]|uniref:RelA/SpoT domain-containing protein n=1 Tax=Coleophoma cylindrospora TaxID=1849047 RepID=A0A3D8S8C8_9HELO|nr:hypothetical protein BP6252_03446 [Coleophoma cylindrospora]